MPKTPSANGAPKKTIKQLREERARLHYETEIARLSHIRDAYRPFALPNPFSQKPQVRRQLQEEWAGTWVDAYLDLVGEWAGGSVFGGQGTPISTTLDRRIGQDWPIFVNEVQLGIYRAPARILCQANGYAIGLLNGICNYVAGTGFTHSVIPKNGVEPDEGLIEECQAVLDEFQVRESWWELERELIWRKHEDGERFLLHGELDGDCWVRTREPEQNVYDPRLFAEAYKRGIIDAAGENPQAGSFGILTDLEDTQTVLGYWFRHLTDAGGEFYPAERIIHRKINTKRSIKRGLTDFCFSTYDALSVGNKLRRNMAMGAAVQAALAGIVQHQTATIPQVNSYMAATAPPNGSTIAPASDGSADNYTKLEPGTFAHIDAASEFKDPPGAAHGDAHALILSTCLRQATARYNAPDWLASSDSSATNFAAALTAESPWVMSVLCEQKYEKEACRKVMLQVLRYAVRRGRLPQDTLDKVDVNSEAPSAMARNTLQEAQENQIYMSLRVKSPQTVCEEQGLDYEKEQANIEAHDERTGGLGTGLDMPEDDEDGDGKPNPLGSVKIKQPKLPAGMGSGDSHPPGSGKSVKESKDEQGHEHKGKGPGGGQFTNGSGKDSHPGAEYGSSVSVKLVKSRVFSGESVSTKTTLTKQETGRVGEAVAQAYLRDILGFKDARPMNTAQANFPIDMIQDHAPTEIKAGMVSNGKDAMKWRLTFSQESKKEKELYGEMTDAQKMDWNAKKQRRIRERKEAVLQAIEKEIGKKAKPQTLTTIINPDTKTADVFLFDGWHDIIRWNSPEAKKAYKGTVAYGHA